MFDCFSLLALGWFCVSIYFWRNFDSTLINTMEEDKQEETPKTNKFEFLNYIGYAVVIGAVAYGVFFFLSSQDTDTFTAQNPVAVSDQIVQDSEMVDEKAVTELVIEDLEVGTGAEAVAGKSVTVHYAGTLTDGTKFDSSVDRNEPFVFNLGAGQVIAGWDQGFNGMKVGGKRKLTIPASLGYGDAGAPPVIPGGATLIFEVELLEVN